VATKKGEWVLSGTGGGSLGVTVTATCPLEPELELRELLDDWALLLDRELDDRLEADEEDRLEDELLDDDGLLDDDRDDDDVDDEGDDDVDDDSEDVDEDGDDEADDDEDDELELELERLRRRHQSQNSSHSRLSQLYSSMSALRIPSHFNSHPKTRIRT
jgi:hypothetical protein